MAAGRLRTWGTSHDIPRPTSPRQRLAPLLVQAWGRDALDALLQGPPQGPFAAPRLPTDVLLLWEKRGVSLLGVPLVRLLPGPLGAPPRPALLQAGLPQPGKLLPEQAAAAGPPGPPALLQAAWQQLRPGTGPCQWASWLRQAGSWWSPARWSSRSEDPAPAAASDPGSQADPAAIRDGQYPAAAPRLSSSPTVSG